MRAETALCQLTVRRWASLAHGQADVTQRASQLLAERAVDEEVEGEVDGLHAGGDEYRHVVAVHLVSVLQHQTATEHDDLSRHDQHQVRDDDDDQAG